MTVEHTATPRQVEQDAVLAFAVSVGCAVAFLVFVALPVHVRNLQVPAAVEGVWWLGVLVGAFLGPVASGLAAFVSASALGAREVDLGGRAGRLHWSSIGVTAVLLVVYAANAGALRLWLD